MQRRRHVTTRWLGPGALHAHLTMAAMAASAALPLLALSLLLPRPLVLPVICLVALAGAAVVALAAWARNADRDGQHVTLWDIAGALAFIGFAAAMLSNPDQIVQFAETANTLNRTH